MRGRHRRRVEAGLLIVLAGASLHLGAGTASPQADAARAADAMAFIRVVGDLHVQFTEVYRAPVVRKNVEVATGSGFVIAPSGLVLTNAHVVKEEAVRRVYDGAEAEITLDSKRVEVAIGPGGAGGVLDGAVVAEDDDLDLAVLQVTAADLPYLPFGDSDAVDPGRPVQVLGFPFGRQVEVGRRADPAVIPQVTVTSGSLSAAREDEAGARRYLQTDAAVQPGSSGGPMLDEEGYAVGVVRMKLARASGAGFGIPIERVKDFLDANGLLGLMPVARLRSGVVHALDWKGLHVEMPDGFEDVSPARLRVTTGETGDGISFRVDRLATTWDGQTLEQAVLGGKALPGFVPAPAAVTRQSVRGQPARRVGSATGTAPGGPRFRLEYALVNLRGEAVVARFLGPPDALAFNLGLVRRSLETLDASRLLTAEVKAPVSPAFEAGDGNGVRVATPSGWSVEPVAAATCGRVPPAETGWAASPPGDFTVVLRALRWSRESAAVVRGVQSCAASAGTADGAAPGGASATYGGRFETLGVSMEARGALVQEAEGSLLLELEAPVSKLPFVQGLFERWVREATAAR